MAETNPVTLAQAKLHVQDKLTLGIIDEFRKSSWLMDHITFDQCATPVGGGPTFTYDYTRQITQPTASFRAINEEYEPQSVNIQRYSVDVKFFGGTFTIDRQLSDIVGIEGLLAHQIRQKVKATSTLFCQSAIIGDCSKDRDSFDGLDKSVTGTETEYKPNVIDLSTSEKIKENAFTLVYEMNKWLKKLYFQPSFIGGNSDAITALSSAAYYLGKYTMRADEWGNEVEFFRGIPLIDFGDKMGESTPIIPTDSSGLTSIYAAYLGLDGFHAICKAGVYSPVVTLPPDFSTAGNVKPGQVEMNGAVVLKHTRAAGVMRNIQVIA